MAQQKKTVRPSFSTAPLPAAPPPVSPPPLDSNIGRLPQLPDPTGDGRLLAPGTIQPRELSPGEIQGLTLIGVDPTKPVPREALESLANLPPEVLAALRAPQARHEAIVAGAMASPVVPQRAVRVEDLPPERQADARRTMASMLASAEGTTYAAQPAPAEKRAVRFPVVADAPPPAQPAPQPAPPPPPAHEPPESDAGGAGVTSPICPRCGFDCRQQDTVVATDADRTAFLACVLALPARRFEKGYQLFDSRLAVRFRELNQREEDEATRAVHRQAAADVEAGSPGGMMYYANLSANYRMVVSLVRLENAEECHELAGGYAEAVKQGKRVEDYFAWVIDNTLPTDSILVVVRRAFDDFVQLCQKLREAASSPDFYSATG